jgi:hypothetical protein
MFLIYSLFAFWLPLFPLAEKIVNAIFKIRYSTLSLMIVLNAVDPLKPIGNVNYCNFLTVLSSH